MSAESFPLGQFLRALTSSGCHMNLAEEKNVALVFTGVIASEIPRLFQCVIKGVTQLSSDQRTKLQVRSPGFNFQLVFNQH